MADLRSKFIEDYAGGLLNVSRQELASTGQVLSQDGLLTGGTLFVEDGTGTKSGLRLGASLCEAIDPTTDQGVVNVRYADRTYASVRDLKIFSTAIASAQAALSDASSVSLTNLENAFELLETEQDNMNKKFDDRSELINTRLEELEEIPSLKGQINELNALAQSTSTRVTSLEASAESSLNRIGSYIRTGGNNNTAGIDFYKTRGADANLAGSLRIEDPIGTISFFGSDGNQKVLGSAITAKAGTAWDNDERSTYIGFSWVGNTESGSSQIPAEWIQFGKPAEQGDEIGPKTITLTSPPEVVTARPNVQINSSGQIVKGVVGVTLAELKSVASGAADFAAFKTAIAGLT